MMVQRLGGMRFLATKGERLFIKARRSGGVRDTF